MGVNACSPDLINDAGFDMWCGESLCGWQLESGSIEKVATWHEQDSGVLMVGPEVAISQRSEAGSGDVQCIEFSLVAATEVGADLYLEMDFLDDGVVEYSEPITSENWSLVQYHITPPTWFQAVRFRVRKVGDADAVVAQVRAQIVNPDICTADPLALSNLPDGAECQSADLCADGFCTTVPVPSSNDDGFTVDTCGSCGTDADCSGEAVCGLSWDERWYGHRECAAPATKALGEACATDGECGSSTCCEGLCSECCEGGPDCTDGAACTRHPAGTQDGAAAAGIMPWMCAAGAGDRGMGEGCVADTDCLSASCQASTALRICDPDGRPCDTDADCPWSAFGGACVTVGAHDGTCQ